MNESRVIVERRDHVLLIGLNRPEKRNAADMAMLTQLAQAYAEFDRDAELRVAVVHAIGEHFTAGLDLGDVAGRVDENGLRLGGVDGINPWQVDGVRLSKPVVMAVQGLCFTLGIELMLASDIVVAADDSVFAQLEVGRGILPFGGATVRFPRAAGWGNAMRWILTGDRFDAAEAHRMGLVQEVVPAGRQLDRAVELAERIAAQAPLAVQATLRNARRAQHDAASAEAALGGELAGLMRSEDAAIGMRAFLERTTAHFVGR